MFFLKCSLDALSVLRADDLLCAVGQRAADQGVAGEAGGDISDAAVLATVKSRLETTNDVRAQGIDVDVTDGVVELRGRVDSPAAAGTAIRLALDTRGVDRVVSYLTWR